MVNVLLNWPEGPLDMNLIQNLWSVLKNQWAIQLRTKEQQIEGILPAWNKLGMDEIHLRALIEDHPTHFERFTRCSTQTVASRDRRMDGSHAVGMCKYKTKYSFSLRQISLIFLTRFRALKFSVLQLTHRDCMLRAKMDLRSIVPYLSMKDMNAREIYADMNDTLGADCFGHSRSRSISGKKVSRSRCLTRMSGRKMKKKISLMK
jgi:hypothetical protein